MSVSLLLLLAAIILFVCGLLAVLGAIDATPAALVDSGLACFAASFLPLNRT